MKKLVASILSLAIMITPMFYTSGVKAETLGDLEKQLNKLENKLDETNKKKAQTEEEINTVNNNITTIKGEIEQTYKDIDSLNEQIEDLNKKIKKADKEIKDIISLLQVANGESAYLEYVSGAESWEGFIYRLAMSEQLSANNDKKIDEFNKMIDENKKKQKEIAGKRVTLGNKQEELKTELAKLGEELETIQSTSISQADDVKAQKEIVEYYKKLGCKANEDISTCGRSLLPPGTAFYRPLGYARVTSEWGYRDYMGKSFHEGIDMGVSEGSPVYAIGTGKVVEVIRYNSCGGNMVIVHHNLKGKTYTSVYAHLLSINASKGQNVTKDTVVGYSGGSSTKSYDRCTGGAHLHLTLAKGLYGIDYGFSAMNYTYSINPRNMINFPALGVYFKDRITKY